jgi:DNA repair protein RadC
MIPEIVVSFKRSHTQTEKIKFKDSLNCYEYIRDLYDSDTIELREEAIAVFCTSHLEVIGFYRLGAGEVNCCIIDTKLIIAIALKCRATSIVLSHNHPSGGLIPSKRDKKVTDKLNEQCKLFDINLMDHLIVIQQRGEYYSFVDHQKI